MGVVTRLKVEDTFFVFLFRPRQIRHAERMVGGEEEVDGFIGRAKGIGFVDHYPVGKARRNRMVAIENRDVEGLAEFYFERIAMLHADEFVPPGIVGPTEESVVEENEPLFGIRDMLKRGAFSPLMPRSLLVVRQRVAMVIEEDEGVILSEIFFRELDGKFLEGLGVSVYSLERTKELTKVYNVVGMATGYNGHPEIRIRRHVR